MIYDVCIIGGGITGLSTAYKTLESDPSLKVCLLEKEAEIALHQTGNNSGVIHAGIYYRPGSLKALNCLRGYRYLLEFCDKYSVPYELCGKLIVAVDNTELAALENLYRRGIENGLERIRKLSREELKEIEPHVNGVAGIHLPYTGIINYKKVCLKIAELLENELGAELRLNTKVLQVRDAGKYSELVTSQGTVKTKLVVNTAGLYSDQIAAMTMENPGVRIIPFRGEYYELKPESRHLVKGLVYPVPDPRFPFLGVHFTRMIDGGVEAGPNAVFALKKEGYRKTDISIRELWYSLSWPGFRKVMRRHTRMGLNEYYRSFSKNAFTRALQRLVPEVSRDDLVPGGAGVRAQACDREGNLLDDFLIRETPLAINVLNAPSPAATACLSIGEHIAERIILKLK